MASAEGSESTSVSIATGYEVSGWISMSILGLASGDYSGALGDDCVLVFRQLTLRLRSACARWKLKVASWRLGPPGFAGVLVMVGCMCWCAYQVKFARDWLPLPYRVLLVRVLQMAMFAAGSDLADGYWPPVRSLRVSRMFSRTVCGRRLVGMLVRRSCRPSMLSCRQCVVRRRGVFRRRFGVKVSVAGGEPTLPHGCQQSAVPSALMPHSGASVLRDAKVWAGAGL